MTVFRIEINDYPGHVLNSFLFESQSGMFSSTTINQLTTGTLNAMQMTIPPADEQSQIAEFLRLANLRFDTLTAAAETAIALLQEGRTTLISAAVTGQIDVRHLAQKDEEGAIIEEQAC